MSASLTVVGGELRLEKSFIGNPVQPGGTLSLRFTLTHGAEAAAPDFTAISFTDDLNAMLAGVSAVGLPLSDPCGAGSQLSGTDSLTFTGGSLAAGESCTIDVVLQIPAAASPGSYINGTSSVTALASGLTITAPAASATLQVGGGASLTKSFIDDPAIPGGSVTLRYSLANESVPSGSTAAPSPSPTRPTGSATRPAA